MRVLIQLTVACLCGVLLLASLSTALVTSSLSSTEASAIVANIKSQSFDSSDDIYSAIKLTEMLGSSLPKSASLIASLRQSLDSSDVSELHAAIAALSHLGEKVTVSGKLKSSLTSALKSNNLLTVYHSLSSTVYLTDSGAIANSDEYDVAGAVAKIQSLEELDHTHRLSTKSDDSSLYFTAWYWRLLSKLLESKHWNTKISKLNELASSALTKAHDAITKNVFTGKDSIDISYGLPSHISQPQALGEVVSSLVTLHQAAKSAKNFPLTSGEVDRIAQYLIDHRHTAQLQELEAIVAGLHTINNLPQALRPVSVSVVYSDGAPSIAVRDLLGKPVTGGDKLTAVINDKSLSLTPSRDGAYAVDTESLEPGHYNVGVKLGSQSLSLKLHRTAPLKSVSAQIYVSDSSKPDDSRHESVAYPKALPIAMVADSAKYLHAKVVVSDAQPEPESVLVLLQRTTSSQPSLSSDDNHSQAFIAKKGTDGSYYVRVNFGSLEVIEALGGGGEFIVTVLVSHSDYRSSLQWPAANVEFQSPQLSHHGVNTDVFGTPKPAIHHTFRSESGKHAYILPLVFTVAQVALFGLLLIVLLTRTSLSLPSSPVELTSSFIFHCSLASIIVLYVIYWLRLNIFQALVATLLLAIVALLSGNKALTARHIRKSKLKEL